MIEFYIVLSCKNEDGELAPDLQALVDRGSVRKKVTHSFVPRVGEMIAEGPSSYCKVTGIYHNITKGTIEVHCENIEWNDFVICTSEVGWDVHL